MPKEQVRAVSWSRHNCSGATSADRCEGMPSVPDDEGVLPCGETARVRSGGACPVDADRCPGLPCVRLVGSMRGTCGEPVPTSGGAGGGATCTGGFATPGALHGRQGYEPSDCGHSAGNGATITCAGGSCPLLPA